MLCSYAYYDTEGPETWQQRTLCQYRTSHRECVGRHQGERVLVSELFLPGSRIAFVSTGHCVASVGQ
eukprot:2763279-Rhodomonas_salina.1